jgi:ubiquinone/menaquinone biosynthesis C-methylase UbiE
MTQADRGPLRRWRQQLVAGARGRVLEIGAGTGLNLPHYEGDLWVIATDPDIGMLRRARQRAVHASANVLLVAADGEALPFREHTFSEVVVGLAMCTIPNPEQALTEIHRILEATGRLRLLEHVRLESPFLGKLQDWLTPLWRRVAGGCRLNRRTAHMVAASGLFRLEIVAAHLGGYLQHIVATPSRTTTHLGEAK